ncbi:hypothetical protein [Streptomyces sp. NBC_01361]|uniref:hypothetical protein n=1 Tax=Streptomyces sp. NBC_01361 TaxID=2903838 RepID=UPI002E34DC4F|nr:hypothetical protein [Streptomyces sp. NBC_01361]
MRTLTSAGAIAVAASAALLLAPSAYATGAHGDNGTVKIHDATTGDELRKNEPHVCTFYLDAFGFDDGQAVDWHIEAWAPTADAKGETVKSGSLTLGSDGHGRTDDLSLPDGHYKLFWNFDGEHGSAKHKVFWTDCSSDNGNENPGGKPSASPAESTTAQPSASASGSASPGAVEPASTAPSSQASSKPSSQTGGDLAETGSSAPVGLLATVAALLVAAGGALLVWRRRAAGRQS